ncbi:unnamed protein product [Clonostachys rosea f. rosea IK726]|uniref:Uncharacterized protein n=1 Tax=Clonostachys rosea f. rosea IK726 TaxID=1349383 RepID=A0ACA9TVI0_BIOOC|nr:unnamed protein product [Clonostachys rosea f. rosea IK726]
MEATCFLGVTINSLTNSAGQCNAVLAQAQYLSSPLCAVAGSAAWPLPLQLTMPQAEANKVFLVWDKVRAS